MNVLERQYGIMSDLDMGEGREFVNYKLSATFPHGGVCYNWNAAGDLKDYTGTVAQWTAIQVAMAEIKQYNTVIIATYVEDKDITVRLRLNDDGELYFIGPDGSVNTITSEGMYTELGGGGQAAKALAGLVNADSNPKYNDCDEHPDVVQGYVNFNWDDAGYLKDYAAGNSAAWGKLNNAKADMQANGTVYLAKYDANRLVELKINEDGDLYFIGPDGSINTITEKGLDIEKAGGGAAGEALAGLLGDGQNPKYNNCDENAVVSGAINYNWAEAGLLKNYDGSTYSAIQAAVADMQANGTQYLAKYDDDKLVELKVDEDGNAYYVTENNNIVTLMSGGSDTTKYLPLSGSGDGYENALEASATVVMKNSATVSPTEYKKPALVIGGLPSAVHLEVSSDTILAKKNETKANPLYLKGTEFQLSAYSETNKDFKTLVGKRVDGTADDSLKWGDYSVVRIPDNGIEGAAAHNGVYRGKNLTKIYTIEQLSKKIKAGDFSDLFIGDYFEMTIPNLNCNGTEKMGFYLADFDYWYRNYNTHCVILVPMSCLATTSQWNPTVDNTDGYYGSAIRTKVVAWGNAMNGASYMNGHLLSGAATSFVCHIDKNYYSAAGANFMGSTVWNYNGQCWQGMAKAELMSEAMVFGGQAFACSGYDAGIGSSQISLFRLMHHSIATGLAYPNLSGYAWWTSSVASIYGAVHVNVNGCSHPYGATGANGVRPALCFS